MGAFLICERCGRKIHGNEPKVTLEKGYRCATCEYNLQMGRGQMTIEDRG